MTLIWCSVSDGWTTADLVYIWKEIDPVQIVKDLNLPRFKLEQFQTTYCNTITNTGLVSSAGISHDNLLTAQASTAVSRLSSCSRESSPTTCSQSTSRPACSSSCPGSPSGWTSTPSLPECPWEWPPSSPCPPRYSTEDDLDWSSDLHYRIIKVMGWGRLNVNINIWNLCCWQPLSHSGLELEIKIRRDLVNSSLSRPAGSQPSFLLCLTLRLSTCGPEPVRWETSWKLNGIN